MRWSRALASVPAAALAGVAAHDLLQRNHALLRNFPVIGHARYLIESIGPELRRWVYASSKLENNYFGFGTDNDVEHTDGYPVIKHRTFASSAPAGDHHAGEEQALPSPKVLGGPRDRLHKFRPASLVNISAMSFGSLSGQAVEALNRGAAVAGCMHNTGEGGLSPYHRNGGDLVLQIGTAYFGCRDEKGRFDLQRLKDLVSSAPVRALEVKLSQGAKPGLGGLLPGPKVTPQIAEIRGIEPGVDCISPSRHAEFTDVDSMLDWVELLAAETGLPVGVKSAVGDLAFWCDLVEQMTSRERGVDFVTIDGGEGGTGASPLVFADSVSLPFRVGFSRVYRLFAEAGLQHDVTFVGSGKLGLPDNAVVAMALGVDMVNVAREAMLAIGCIQAQRCHTDRCPTGVATQDPWLSHGLDPALKSVRVANYVKTLRRDLLKLAGSCGVSHPALIDADDVEVLHGDSAASALREVFGYRPGWGAVSPEQRDALERLMAGAPEGGSAPASATAQG
jgi:glutamate synthase domain-containing protein 2